MRPSAWADRLMALSVRAMGLVILLGALGAAAASFFYNQAQEADQAGRVAMQIDDRLRDHISALEGVRALYESDMAANGPAIRAYLTALQPQVRSPGMQGIGIAIAMQQATPAAAEARLRQNYGRDIRVWPTTDQPIGFPIILLEPDDTRNHPALGFDMYSEPVRREAMRRAWQTGRPAASGIVELLQETRDRRKQPGFLIYIPVYAATPSTDAIAALPPVDAGGGSAVATAGGGVRPIEAFVYAPFRVGDLMRAVLGSQLESIDGIEVFAGDGPSAPRVFTHGVMRWDAHEEHIRVADRLWTVRISYGRFIDRIGRPLGILLFGLAIAVLATQLHRLQQRRLGAFQALAEEKARHAEDRELIMGEMAHRMKNAFARIGALARITAREAGDLATFEAKFDGRLRALSDAKQMLVTGAVDSVELGAIVRRELTLAGWDEERLASLSGPEVRLADEGAQAVALAIHEFVTNSIKYGALADKGTLAVHWRRDGTDIELSWIESDLPETPHFVTESFGTHFIRSLIERQLKGRWHRHATNKQLAILIRWPDQAVHG